jgi:hypothetical protein
MFCSLRDQTRQDAVVYSSEVLPLVEVLVTNLSEYFDNYIALDLEVSLWSFFTWNSLVWFSSVLKFLRNVEQNRR